MDNQPIQSPPPPPSSINSPKTFILVAGVIASMAVSALGGYFLGANKQYPSSRLSTQPSQSLTPTPTPTPTPLVIPTTDTSITANWKTYTDTQNGFSFKYPNKGNVDQTSNGVDIMLEPGSGFNPGSGIFFVVGVIDNPENLSLEKFHEDYDNVPFDPKKSENVIINGLNALKAHSFPSAGTGYDAYYLQNGKNIYRLGWHSSYTEEEEQLGNQILSTFKFTQ